MPLIGLRYGTRPIWIKWLLEVPLANGGRRVSFLRSLPLRTKAAMRTYSAERADGCSHACTEPLCCFSFLISIAYHWIAMGSINRRWLFLGSKTRRGTFAKHNHLLWWSSHTPQMKGTNVSRCGGGFTDMVSLMVSYLMIVLTQR